jgi:hypothetical protein
VSVLFFCFKKKIKIKVIYNITSTKKGERSRKPVNVEYKQTQTKKRSFKMANLINEAEVRSTWSPIIEEATGITESNKLAWMSEYCHNHKLYEDANIMSLSPNMNLAGMGAVSYPDPSSANTPGSGETGSGDKAPTLLPLAMQVAAQTIGLDLVPVVPMAGPMGLLSYLDYTYEGGKVDNSVAPTYIKADPKAGTDNIATGDPATNAGYTFIGTSRIDGYSIFKVGETLVEANVSADLAAATGETEADLDVQLVKAMEDHIKGFAAADEEGNPFSRKEGEETPDKVMGLSLFSKSVAAETFQVAAAVTREQVQDLKQFGVDAVAQVESVLTNELTQSLNDHILKSMRTLAGTNTTDNPYLNTTVDLAPGTTYGGETRGEAHRRILTNILAAANFIANKGRRGAGNFAVVDAKIASALQGVAGFVPNPMANTFNQVAGAIYPVGSVAGINVYTDPRLPFNGVPNNSANEHRILVGRKGDGNSAGLVFMPYLMAESVQTIAEGTMAPKVAVKSRFALVEAGFHPETQYVEFKVEGVEL